jgi:hypothetical protein
VHCECRRQLPGRQAHLSEQDMQRLPRHSLDPTFSARCRARMWRSGSVAHTRRSPSLNRFFTSGFSYAFRVPSLILCRTSGSARAFFAARLRRRISSGFARTFSQYRRWPSRIFCRIAGSAHFCLLASPLGSVIFLLFSLRLPVHPCGRSPYAAQGLVPWLSLCHLCGQTRLRNLFWFWSWFKYAKDFTCKQAKYGVEVRHEN